jgi:PAS domain S-box-containing protein
MQDMRKTKAQLVVELEQLRQQVASLEARVRELDQQASRNHQAEQALEDSERTFHSLAESTKAHICVVQDDRYAYANQAFLDYYGVDEEELQLIAPEEMMMGMMTSEATARARTAWEDAMERGASSFHFEMNDVEGNWFQLNVSMTQLDGKESVVMMATDITELKRAQQEMYRADKMAALGQIVAGVAHEINNPNNFIYFNLPILRKYIEAMTPLLEPRLECEPDFTILGMPFDTFLEDIFKLLENMEHGSTRITSIVSDLKNYVRSDEDQQRRREQVSRAIERVMTLVGKQVRKMVKRLDVDVEEALPLVEMNVGKVEQVLINLLINAGHAADKDASWVKLSARRAAGAEDWIEVLVEDNGAGIPQDRLEQIFEPFFTSKGRDQGTGLGLSISQRIIEEHGGTLTVTSDEGVGSCFSVRLPVAPAAENSSTNV